MLKEVFLTTNLKLDNFLFLICISSYVPCFIYVFFSNFYWTPSIRREFLYKIFWIVKYALRFIECLQGHLFRIVGKQLVAVKLCSDGWEKSPGMGVSLVFGFRYVDEFSRDFCPRIHLQSQFCYLFPLLNWRLFWAVFDSKLNAGTFWLLAMVIRQAVNV